MQRFIFLVMMTSIATIYLPTLAQDQPRKSAAQLTENAIYAEETAGDLGKAQKLYEQIIAEHAENGEAVAHAKARLALIQLRNGKRKKGVSTIQSLAKQLQTLVAKDKATEIPDSKDDIEASVNFIRKNYIDELSVDSSHSDAELRVLFSELDSYSSYMTKDQLKDLFVNIDGKLIGIGVVLDYQNERLMIKGTVPGSGASEAGLVDGDEIVSIDGVPLREISEQTTGRMQAIVSRLRGKAGTSVKLRVKSKGVDEPKAVEIVRRKLTLPSIEGFPGSSANPNQWRHTIPHHPRIGYVRVSQFSKRTVEEFNLVFNGWEQKQIQSLIIDLRNTPGGLLAAAADVADIFLPAGVVVETRGREEDENFVYRSSNAQRLSGVPIVVLVNRKTSSSAEIFAAAMQDRGRATIVGERTFGKGTVQAIFSLPSGGAMKLTTARFIRPNGKPFEKTPNSDDWGVSPDQGMWVEDQERILLNRPSEDDPVIAKAIEILSNTLATP